jgi:hypothetical protein
MIVSDSLLRSQHRTVSAIVQLGAICYSAGLERDGFKLNRHRALDLWWSMIFSESRHPLFRIML